MLSQILVTDFQIKLYLGQEILGNKLSFNEK